MNRRLWITVGLIAFVVLCAGLVWSSLSGNVSRELPQGTQTLTGSLIPAELSLTRRGTHVLKVEGKDIAYVESASVNLRQYELTEVGVTGRFVENTDPADLPVLVVTSLRPIDIPARSVDVPSVGLTLRVPLEWNVQLFDDGAAMSLTGSSTPLLRVMRSSLTRLPAGTPMVVAGYDAVRDTGPQGEDIVHLSAGRSIVTFTWMPSPDGDDRSAAFAQLLRTAVVRTPASDSGATLSSRSPAPLNGSGTTAQPCGGPAGILCPAGSFCSVTAQDGVGTCVPLR